MEALGYLFLILIIAAIGFALGSAFQRSGRSLPEEITRLVPADGQGSKMAWSVGIGAVLAYYFFVLASNQGPPLVPPFFLLFLLPAWVYVDARERGGRALAWALLTLFTQPLGFTAYLITRPEKPRSCPRCDFKLREDFLVCPYCGPQAGSTCSNCQSALDSTWRYCPYCQTNVTSADNSQTNSTSIRTSSEHESPVTPPPHQTTLAKVSIT